MYIEAEGLRRRRRERATLYSHHSLEPQASRQPRRAWSAACEFIAAHPQVATCGRTCGGRTRRRRSPDRLAVS